MEILFTSLRADGSTLLPMLISRSPEQTQRLGVRIGELSLPGDIFLLVGKLGTGKTCLTQGIAWGLHIKEYAVSPSFVLVRELHGRLPLYHIDLYRLSDERELCEIGYEEYIGARGVTVIEWADRIPHAVPDESLWITLRYRGAERREIVMRAHGVRYEKIIEELRRNVYNNHSASHNTHGRKVKGR